MGTSGARSVIAACYSKSCAPPPVGSGGSSGEDGDTGYRGAHEAPNREEPNASISNIEQVMPDVMAHPEWYSHSSDLATPEDSATARAETMAAFQKAAGDPDAMITVYRAVPKGASKMQPGDWVTPSKTYAEHHGEAILNGESEIQSRDIRAGDLWSSGDSIYELGWDPSTPFTKYGLSFDPEGAKTVAHVRRLDKAKKVDWDKIPVTEITPDRMRSLRANEETVRSPEDIAKVVSGREALREGYVAKLYEAPDGSLHIVDGHHRVAIYAGLNRPMPAHIYRDPQPQVASLLAACYDKVCAPPEVGTGGSSPTGSTLIRDPKKRTPKALAKAMLGAIKRGRVVSVSRKELAGVLGEIADDKSRLIDLGKVHVRGTRLFATTRGKISREKMPQIPDPKRDQFFDELSKRGIKSKKESVDPTKLRPTQSNFAGPKVGQLVGLFRANGELPGKPIIVSSDGYVLDGHHRWAAMAVVGMQDRGVKLPIVRVDMPIKDLLKAGLDFGKREGIATSNLADVAGDTRGAGR